MDTRGPGDDPGRTDEPNRCDHAAAVGPGLGPPWYDEQGQGYLDQRSWERAARKTLLTLWRSEDVAALRAAHASGDKWLVSQVLTPHPSYACLPCLCHKECAFHPHASRPGEQDLILDEGELPEVE